MGSVGHKHGSFFKDSWLILGDVFLDVSNLNMILYEFITAHMNFTENEHVKHDEALLNIQGYLKSHYSNDMDVHERLTLKLNKT